MAKYDDLDGVWRTIGGRRVFIRDGQSLSDAMKKSGKFKSAKKNVKGPDSKEVKEINDKVTKDWGSSELDDTKEALASTERYLEKHPDDERMKKRAEILKKDVERLTKSGEPDKKTSDFVSEVKNYKPKGDDEYHSAKDVLLSRFNRTYNDGDTIKDKYETRMKNIRILEESEDYVLYANKDDDSDFISVQEISSWDPKSRFREMPNVYFEQDYKGNIKKGSAQVNWAAYGSQDPQTTKEFIGKLTKAQEFAERINEGKDYSKLWDDRINKQTNNIANSLQRKAYEKYLKEHPASKMSFEEFKKK